MTDTLIIVLTFLAITVPAQAEEGMHLFILSGQSNMRGPLPDSFERFVSEVFGEDDDQPNGLLYDESWLFLDEIVVSPVAGPSAARASH